jgi:hypothetical protein
LWEAGGVSCSGLEGLVHGLSEYDEKDKEDQEIRWIVEGASLE